MDMPIRDTRGRGGQFALSRRGWELEDPARRFGEESFRRVVEWAPRPWSW